MPPTAVKTVAWSRAPGRVVHHRPAPRRAVIAVAPSRANPAEPATSPTMAETNMPADMNSRARPVT